MFPNLNFDDFMSALNSASRKDFFLELQNKSCERNKFDYDINYNVALGHSADKHLDEALEKGKLASIEYDSNIFTEIVTPKPVLNIGNHVSTIIARRWNARSGTCEYQIKNSWGDDWAPTSPHANMDGAGDGFVWVPEDEIKTATVGVSYLE